jgi:hypothetical protein
MQLPARAALLAATVGLVAGGVVGACIYAFLLRPDLPRSHLIMPSALLAGATAAAGAIVVFGFVRWRQRNGRLTVGRVAGAVIGVVVLALVTLVHAAAAPGADGLLVSFLGQFAAALLLVGWLAAALGVALGRFINQMAGTSGT